MTVLVMVVLVMVVLVMVVSPFFTFFSASFDY